MARTTREASTMGDLLEPCRVLPVITATGVGETLQLCRTLAAAGMRAVEITLRTPAAMDTIRAVVTELPDLLVAAGTVTNPRELDRALEAGADFIVSPGSTATLLGAARSRDARLVPGVASASEVMLGLDYGIDTFKLFPAAAVGGVGLLKSLGGPFPSVRFCPTGGLDADNFRSYLALPNVVCCGGSWMVAPELVAAQQWDRIAALAKEAVADTPANGK